MDVSSLASAVAPLIGLSLLSSVAAIVLPRPHAGDVVSGSTKLLFWADSDGVSKEDALAMQEAYFRDIYANAFGSSEGDEPEVPAELTSPKLLPGPRESSIAFRTMSCDEFVKNPHWEDALDVITVAPDNAKPRIACLVYSYHAKRQAMRDSFATWGQDCDTFLPFSDEEFVDTEAGFTTIEVHPANGDEKNLIGKVKAAFTEVRRRVDAGELQFDFLTVSGDDSFWILPNLRQYLSTDPNVTTENAAGRGIYLGRRMSADGGRTTFNSGAGYVLNMAAFNHVLKGAQRYPEGTTGWWEDVYLAGVLMEQNVTALPTEEGLAQRFHPFDPAMMAMLNYDGDDWVNGYTRFYPRTNGVAGISSQSILFHYMTDSNRVQVYNQFYHKDHCKDTR